jgi:hypothetical protein
MMSEWKSRVRVSNILYMQDSYLSCPNMVWENLVGSGWQCEALEQAQCFTYQKLQRND